MPRFEKWLTAASPNAPADSVARAALAERLLAVRYFLKHAVRDPKAPETIHQLRVWTRRASAALDLFAPAAPAARSKRMQKLLRKLRRAAGNIRDCDIHLEQLQRDDSDIPHSIVQALKHQRRSARQKVRRLGRTLRHDRHLDGEIDQLLEKIDWPKRHSNRQPPLFGVFCRQQLRPLANDFFDRSRADLLDHAALHALRIAGKRLRYALELAPTVLPASEHHALCTGLKEAQDRMGAICDQFAANAQLRVWIQIAKKRPHRQQLKKLLERDERRLITLRRKFLVWWAGAARRLRRQWKCVNSGNSR